MTSISQSIWNHVKQEGMALSYMAKHHSHKVNSKMIRHLTLSALVLASIPTSAVFVSANEPVDNYDSEVAVQNLLKPVDPDPDSDKPEAIKKSNTTTENTTSMSKTSAAKTNSTTSTSTNVTAADDFHFISINGGKTTDKNYANNGATGTDSIVIGIGSTASGKNATVIGNNNTLTGGNNGIIVGQGLNVKGINNAVFGTDYQNGDYFKGTRVYGDRNTVIGIGNTVGYTATEITRGNWSYTPSQTTKGDDENVVVGMKNTGNGGSIIVGMSSEAKHHGMSFGDDNKVNLEPIILKNKNTGEDVKVTCDWGLALGRSLTVTGIYGIAIGQYSTVYGNSAIGIGQNSNVNGHYAISLGYGTKTKGNYSISIGGQSSATGVQSIALGAAANASVDNGIAIGSLSVADRGSGVAGWDPDTGLKSTDTSAVWTSTRGAFSVGNFANGKTRQITNVAAGTEDTDAVNVAQLKRAMKESAEARSVLKREIDDIGGTGTDTTIKSITGKYNKDAKQLNLTLKDSNDKDISSTIDIDIGNILSSDPGLTTTTRDTIEEGDHIKVVKTDGAASSGTKYTISVKDDGEVVEGNKGLVTGGTVWKESHDFDDGTYINKQESTGANLKALDDQVKQNADSIISLGDTVYDLSNRVGEMDDRINKVGAGAAALAALHPLDYNPEDKWDIAAGFGNYKNASAGALGLFYRPNERTQFNVGWTMGDDRNMFNAGFSVKLGQGSSYAGYSKADMAQLITKQKDEIAALQATIGEQEKEIQQIEEKMNALMARWEKNK